MANRSKKVVAVAVIIVASVALLVTYMVLTGGKAGAEAWVKEGVRILGTYADADVVKLPDGRYRMYYGIEPEVPGNQLEVYSAISSDGLTWSEEPGIRIRWAAMPTVIELPDGRWRMYYQGRLALKPCILSAISEDGLTFTREEGIRLETGGQGSYDSYNIGSPTIIRLDDGTYRMYYRGSMYDEASIWEKQFSFILSATSKDGLTWTKELGVRIDGRQSPFEGHVDGPYATKLPEGTYRLYFFVGSQDSSRDGIYKADSKDGINFTVDNHPILPKSEFGSANNPPGDPCVIKMSDGWRMYYGIHTQGIFSAKKR